MNFKLINLKLVVFLYFLVLFAAFWFFLVVISYLVISYRKKNKKFKTSLMTSFILLLFYVTLKSLSFVNTKYECVVIEKVMHNTIFNYCAHLVILAQPEKLVCNN